MGFLDKAKEAAKEAADKAKAVAQQGAATAQDKFDDMKTERAEKALITALGEAFYAEQRHAGSHEVVLSALTAIDDHHAGVAAQAAKDAAAKAAAAKPDSATAPGGGDIVDAVIVED